MANKILYQLRLDADGDNAIRYEMDENRRIIEREKVNGYYKDDRYISPTAAGYAIAARRVREDFVWSIPGELVGALSLAIAEKSQAYWGVTLAQSIQKMVDPRYEVVDYAALRAAEGSAQAA